MEQLEWIAEDIVQRKGDAYVLPVMELTAAEEEQIRRRMGTERHREYRDLKQAAETLARRVAKADPRRMEPLERSSFTRELAALERRFASAVGRDHFVSADHDHAKRAIERAQSAVQRRNKTDR